MTDSEPDLRRALTGLQELLVMTMLMLDRRDVDEVIEVLAQSVEAVTRCRLVDVRVPRDHGLPARAPGRPPWSDLDPGGGVVVEGHGDSWTCTTPVSALATSPGRLVLGCSARPDAEQLFVIERLGHLLGSALVDAGLHERDRRRAVELDAANAELARTLAALRHREAVQEELIHLVATGTELDLITSLSRLTGRAVVLRDRFAHEVARVAPADQPLAAHREEPLAAVIGGRQDFGTVELEMPTEQGGCTEDARFALQFAGVALGLLGARAAAMSEIEDRLSRDLLGDLVEGLPDEAAVHRAAAQGHDLRVPHDVVVAMWSSETGSRTDRGDVERLRAAVAHQGLRCLVTRDRGMAVALAPQGVDIARIYDDLCRAYGDPDGVVARGESISSPAHVPRALEQARRALTARQQSGDPRGCVAYAGLGVERILALDGNVGEVERLIHDWLGDLVGYDDDHGTELVTTLAAYLDHGGSYDQSAQALSIHRSTLRYRLGRIAAISGHDLSDVETRLNVHLAVRAWRLRRAPVR